MVLLLLFHLWYQYYLLKLSKALLNQQVYFKCKQISVNDFSPFMLIIAIMWEQANSSLIILVCVNRIFSCHAIDYFAESISWIIILEMYCQSSCLGRTSIGWNWPFLILVGRKIIGIKVPWEKMHWKKKKSRRKNLLKYYVTPMCVPLLRTTEMCPYY